MDGYIKSEMELDLGVSPANLLVQVPQTPKKHGGKRGSDTANSPTPVKRAKPTPEKRTPSKKGVKPMPTSFEEAGPDDRLILQLKDKENKSWAEIKDAWEAFTGLHVAAGSLSVRYQRMKANFVTWTEKDEASLLEIKKELEEKFEQERWTKIAEGIAAKSGNRFPAAAVHKKFKELVKRKSTSALVANEEHYED